MFLFHTVGTNRAKSVSKRSTFHAERRLRAPAALSVGKAGPAGTPIVGPLERSPAEIPRQDLGPVQESKGEGYLEGLEQLEFVGAGPPGQGLRADESQPGVGDDSSNGVPFRLGSEPTSGARAQIAPQLDAEEGPKVVLVHAASGYHPVPVDHVPIEPSGSSSGLQLLRGYEAFHRKLGPPEPEQRYRQPVQVPGKGRMAVGGASVDGGAEKP